LFSVDGVKDREREGTSSSTTLLLSLIIDRDRSHSSSCSLNLPLTNPSQFPPETTFILSFLLLFFSFVVEQINTVAITIDDDIIKIN
ncbi:hypothetical protein PMAYCL1PPCAC_24018, partial [Pristionchus mayeri]